MTNKYLGVDAGATKTKAVLFDNFGNIINESIKGHGNIILKEEEAINNVISAISDCLRDVTEFEKVNILIGMAGVGISNKSKYVEQIVRKEFIRNLDEIKVIDDGYFGMISGLKNKDGICLNVGTVSIIYAQKKERLLE